MIENLDNKLKTIVFELYSYVQKNQNIESGLLSGIGGIYLLLFLYQDIKSNKFKDIENLFFNYIQNIVQTPKQNYTDGLSGIGWLLEFLCQSDFIDRIYVDTLLSQIDELSMNFASNCFINNNHDFLYGALGEGNYLLSRVSQSKKIRTYFSKMLAELDKLGKKNESGQFWEESAFMIPEDYKNKKVINLGLSHGLASKIVFLSLLIEQNIQVSVCERMLRESIRFLLNCKSKYTNISLFPSTLVDFKGDNSAIRWSYGDLGIGWAFWKAGSSLKDDSLKDEAIKIFLNIACRLERGEDGINETSICRGSSGVANVFRNIYRETKREDFKKVSDNMLEMTLKIMNHHYDIAGVKTLNNSPLKENELYLENNPYLLMGSAGVGLVLLSFSTSTEYYWDKCLLMS